MNFLGGSAAQVLDLVDELVYAESTPLELFAASQPWYAQKSIQAKHPEPEEKG